MGRRRRLPLLRTGGRLRLQALLLDDPGFDLPPPQTYRVALGAGRVGLDLFNSAAKRPVTVLALDFDLLGHGTLQRGRWRPR